MTEPNRDSWLSGDMLEADVQAVIEAAAKTFHAAVERIVVVRGKTPAACQAQEVASIMMQALFLSDAEPEKFMQGALTQLGFQCVRVQGVPERAAMILTMKTWLDLGIRQAFREHGMEIELIEAMVPDDPADEIGKPMGNA